FPAISFIPPNWSSDSFVHLVTLKLYLGILIFDVQLRISILTNFLADIWRCINKGQQQGLVLKFVARKAAIGQRSRVAGEESLHGLMHDDMLRHLEK
ncbi:hypothetical protein, partial [Janthinobacterium agaricidamnosum]|uniref:hypothetical protein n=1 Tax=Janthinobacterium agaricidamnosum TaxID=55508 RepID=UPI001C3F1550